MHLNLAWGHSVTEFGNGMDDFKFINETVDSSGKVTSRQARTTIRACASRHHWKSISLQHFGGQDQDSTTPNGANQRRLSKARLDGARDKHVEMKYSAVSRDTFQVSSQTLEEAPLSRSHHQDESEAKHGPHKVMDVFPRIGIYNDTLARRFFNHYLVECQSLPFILSWWR